MTNPVVSTAPPITGQNPPVNPYRPPAAAVAAVANPAKARQKAVVPGDEAKVRRAAFAVGLYVAFASALLVLIGAAILIIVLVRRTVRYQPPGFDPNNPRGWMGDPNWQPSTTYLIDRDQLLVWIIVLTIVGVAALGAVAWLASRRAIAPLAEALRLQRHFVADASHELRTPLTVLNSRVQILQRRLDKGDPVDETVTALRLDTQRLNDVLNDLLLSVEGAAPPGQECSSAAAAAQEGVESLRVIADQAGVELNLDCTSSSRVGVPQRSLARAVVALADNAIQHSPAGSQVLVSVGDEGPDVVIRVADQGSGVAQADQERIFERFSHGRESGRQRSFGLGLALVSEIAARFGGDLAIESTGTTGTVFRLRFPSSH